MDKRCSRCALTKPLSDYYLTKNGKPRNSYCKPCWNSYVSARRRAGAAARRAARPPRTHKTCALCKESKLLAAFRSVQREGRTDYDSYCTPCKSHYARARRYGVSPEWFKKAYDSQGGLCLVCEHPMTLEGNRTDRTRACVDHDHENGLIRGLLCQRCNSAIGQLGEDPERLWRATQHVARFRDLADWVRDRETAPMTVSAPYRILEQ